MYIYIYTCICIYIYIYVTLVQRGSPTGNQWQPGCKAWTKCQIALDLFEGRAGGFHRFHHSSKGIVVNEALLTRTIQQAHDLFLKHKDTTHFLQNIQIRKSWEWN